MSPTSYLKVKESQYPLSPPTNGHKLSIIQSLTNTSQVPAPGWHVLVVKILRLMQLTQAPFSRGSPAEELLFCFLTQETLQVLGISSFDLAVEPLKGPSTLSCNTLPLAEDDLPMLDNGELREHDSHTFLWAKLCANKHFLHITSPNPHHNQS